MTSGAALVEIALLVPVLVFAWLPQPVPAKKAIPVVAMGESFDEVWKDTVPKIRVIPITVAKTVKTERIVPVPQPHDAPVDVPPVPAMAPPVDRPAASSRRHVVVLRRDVCARHGMKKTMVGRHKWRCRR
ncbi:MAG: hypothetical protein EHM23_00230 [Acidobacteria bacterium]|nr:MAG: hypothetical protein EHM23_00230 [Acidobacteriota bacterium]